MQLINSNEKSKYAKKNPKKQPTNNLLQKFILHHCPLLQNSTGLDKCNKKKTPNKQTKKLLMMSKFSGECQFLGEKKKREKINYANENVELVVDVEVECDLSLFPHLFMM